MIAEGGDGFAEDFGATTEAAPADIIPFPNMRANRAVSEKWDAEIRRMDTKHRFASPLGVLDDLLRKRAMPAMPWPANWPELSKRARLHPGDCIGIVGPQGGGKTSFAIQLCRAAMGDSIPVLWCPLELDETQIATRIIANMNGIHSIAVRESWTREKLAHALASVDDMWRFVTRYPEPTQQLAALADGIALAKRVYRVPPVVVIDYLGKLASLARDIRQATVQAAEQLRALAVASECYVVLLAQPSRANNAVLTGRTDVDAATDAIATAGESAEIESACRVMLGLNVFKVDDSLDLDAHVLVTKSNTGLEGRVGFRFSKPGGVWTELDFLPATPSEIKTSVAKAKADKHRIAAPPSAPEARADLNQAKAGDADAARRVTLLNAITRHGMLGMETRAMSHLRGVGRTAAIMRSLRELDRAGAIEPVPGEGDRWRIIPRSIT